MSDKSDYLLLKWGTLKGWSFHNSPKALAALEKYVAIGSCISAAMQKDTPEQKQLIIEMIDTVKGPVSLDWTNETFKTKKAKEKAKEYILNYGTEKEKKDL